MPNFTRTRALTRAITLRKHVIDEAVAKLTKLGIEAFGVKGDVRDFDLCVQGVNEVSE